MNNGEIGIIPGNLYWTDALYNWIMMARAEVKTNNTVAVVRTGFDQPYGIAVYPQKQYVQGARGVCKFSFDSANSKSHVRIVAGICSGRSGASSRNWRVQIFSETTE